MVASFWGAVVQKRISLRIVRFLLEFGCWSAKLTTTLTTCKIYLGGSYDPQKLASALPGKYFANAKDAEPMMLADLFTDWFCCNQTRVERDRAIWDTGGTVSSTQRSFYHNPA